MVTSEQAVCLDDRISFVVSCLDGTVDQNLVDEYTKKRHQLYQRAISRSRITHVGSGQLIFVESSDVLASSIGYEHANTVIIKDPCTIVWEKNETT